MPKLKICGITRLEDARFCAAAGADFLGFVQYEASPRYVDPTSARAIIEWVHGPKPVGVFVNAPPAVVNRTAEEAGFELVQLHGEESPSDCAKITRPVIKALRVQSTTSAEELSRMLSEYRDVAAFFLLDTYARDARGGTGRTFDWRVAREAARAHRIFLAGGLRTSNLDEAVQTVRPFAVDVSSSVESEPGVKDFDKLADFFQAFGGLETASSKQV